MNIIFNACSVLNLSLQQLFDAFADYWVMTYSQNIYSLYYRNARNAKEFLTKMDYVHSSITKNVVNANPPRFNYIWKNEKTLIMEYNSKRGLIDLMISLAKAVGKYYNENLIVNKISETQAEIIFGDN